MKKLLILFVVGLMTVSLVGTAVADNTVSLSDTTTTLRISQGPVSAQDTLGTTVYVVSGNGQYVGDTTIQNGVSLFSVDTNATDTNGLMYKKELTRRMRVALAGATPMGGPIASALWKDKASSASGTSVYFLIAAPQSQSVANLTRNRTSINSGMTLYCMNGDTGVTSWERGIAFNQLITPGIGVGLSGSSLFAASPITMDTESASTSGVTLYGTTGIAVGPIPLIDGGGYNVGAGASIFAIDGDTGALVTGGVTQFGTGGGNGVSGFYAAPVISGDTLYVIGWNGFTTGMTMFALQKNNIVAGVSQTANILKVGVDLSRFQIPTPATSGSSIFVVAVGVGGWAGVTVYERDKLVVQYTVPSYGPATGVSASPVSDGSYVVLSTMSAVTCYEINRLSEAGTAGKWSIDLTKSPYTDGTYRIYGTPSISNGYVWIPVTDISGANKGFVLRCLLNSTTGSASKVGGITEMVVASPIVVYDDVVAVTYNPTVTKITQSGARGYADWSQFKFDKGKAGASNRAAAAAAVVAEDDSGCFISTLTK